MATTDFFCPVCNRDIERLWVWQDPGSDRIRLFCAACAAGADYRGLPKHECRLMVRGDFQAFTGLRLLRHIREREERKQGEANSK